MEKKIQYPLSQKYATPVLMEKIMGPNPIKLEEELLCSHKIPTGASVLDLGSGQGLTSVFLAREYGFHVTAADLWSEPEENTAFYQSIGLSDSDVTFVKADATALPFERETFDAVVCTDSYNYFGRDKQYLDKKLLPCVKKGGLIYLAITGMKKDLHDDLPPELLLSWTPEQMEYLHDIPYWRAIFAEAKDAELLDLYEMQSMDEVWEDWLAQENPYAVGDRKSMRAGAGRYLNFIGAVLRKK